MSITEEQIARDSAWTNERYNPSVLRGEAARYLAAIQDCAHLREVRRRLIGLVAEAYERAHRADDGVPSCTRTVYRETQPSRPSGRMIR